jgi:hypothetical protein
MLPPPRKHFFDSGAPFLKEAGLPQPQSTSPATGLDASNGGAPGTLMITERDVEYHDGPGADHRYAETNWFCVYIPQERLMAIIYTVARRAVGVQSCDISIYGDLVDTRAETLYLDSQMALPAPPKLSSYTTANGLSVRAVNPPRDYRVDYVGYDDTEIHLDFKGLMEPFDIHDPNHSPLAKLTVEEQHAGAGMGAGYGGHFDLTGHFTGTLKLRGREFAIDCVETMDHSWGNRAEIFVPTMGWSHAHFGKDLAIKWINHWDPSQPLEQQQKLAHGYVLEDGKVFGLTDLKLLTHRIGNVIHSVQIVATDHRGRTFEAVGTAETGGPWICYAGSLVYAAQCRWTLRDGRVGYGLVSEITSLQALTRRFGRRWNESSRRITS